MPKMKRPEPIKKVPEVNADFTLEPITEKIMQFVDYVKVASKENPTQFKDALNSAKFLVRDLMELKKEKDLPSRSSAVQLLYKNYAEWVKKLPEEAEADDGLKAGAHPKTVTVKGATKCPRGCDEKYHAALIKQIKDSKTWSYEKDKRTFRPTALDKQKGHEDGKGWKAYVDAGEGSGTRWRMLFTWTFEPVDEELTVTINDCKLGH